MLSAIEKASPGERGDGRRTQHGEQARQTAQGQANHVGVTTLQALYRSETSVLDGIGASLIHRITAGNIRFDLGIAIIAHPDGGGDEVLAADFSLTETIWQAQNNQGRGYLVRTGTQAAQHGSGFMRRGGFPQNVLTVQDGGVRSDDDIAWGGVRRDAPGFFERQALDINRSKLTGLDGFIHVSRLDLKIPATQGEQSAPPGRGGSQP